MYYFFSMNIFIRYYIMLKFRIKYEKSVDFINIFVKLWYWFVKSPVL